MDKLKNGRKRKVKDHHIEFLKEWFAKVKNTGKTFK